MAAFCGFVLVCACVFVCGKLQEIADKSNIEYICWQLCVFRVAMACLICFIHQNERKKKKLTHTSEAEKEDKKQQYAHMYKMWMDKLK